MTDPTESTAAAAKESVEPTNTDAEQSDGMGSEGGPEMQDKSLPAEPAEEEAAKTGDFAQRVRA